MAKKYVEEILGISFRARHKESNDCSDKFNQPIIHRQINGDKVYSPLRRDLWNQ